MKLSHALKMKEMMHKAAASLGDADALEAVELFPAWGAGLQYAVGDRRRYEGTLYKCVQGHTSQADWTPDNTPALWTPVSLDEWPAWVQPLGSADAYNTGDKVSHNDKHWISSIDANVWEPGVYGWEESE